jgi:hypothetical protein
VTPTLTFIPIDREETVESTALVESNAPDQTESDDAQDPEEEELPRQGVERRLAVNQERRALQLDMQHLHERFRNIEDLARATHDAMVFHVQEDRETNKAVEELLTLWKGSKMLASAMKIIIPVVAGFSAAIFWFRDHWK